MKLKAQIIATDLGIGIKQIDLNNLLLTFEKKGFDVVITRRLRNLAQKNLNEFLEVIATWKHFKRFLSTCKTTEWNILKGSHLRYILVKSNIKEYVSAIRFLTRFGTIALADESLGGEFSPYYLLGREIPLLIKINSFEQNSTIESFYIKLFSSGLISTMLILSSIKINNGDIEKISEESMNKNDVEEAKLIINEMKTRIEQIKREILLSLIKRKPEYAFYYSDRYEVVILKKRAKRKINVKMEGGNDASEIINISGDRFEIEKENSIIYCDEITEKHKRILYLFEIGLLQKYFLTTRDSYIDKYIKEYKIVDKLKSLERYLVDFLEVVKSFLFAKDEGGKQKIFVDKEFYILYGKIQEILGIDELVIHVGTKIREALNVFALVSSIKRERAILYLTYFIAVLTLLLATEIIIRMVFKI